MVPYEVIVGSGASSSSTFDRPADTLQTHVEDRLRRGLVRSVAPFGPRGAFADLLFYLRNNHVLLSAFAADPGHPYSPQRRRLVLLNSIGFAFFLACLASLGDNCGSSCDREARGWLLNTPVLLLMRDWPTTLCVLLQLLWDVPGASLGICHCAQQGPCPRSCGRGMLVCFVCHLLGMVYGAAGALLLFLFSQVLSLVEWQQVLRLLATTKALAFAIAVPLSALIFAILWRAEGVAIEGKGEAEARGGSLSDSRWSVPPRGRGVRHSGDLL